MFSQIVMFVPAFIGYLSHPMGELWLAPLVALAYLYGNKRQDYFLIMLSYYLGASIDIPSSFAVFTGNASLLKGVLLWFATSVALSSMYALHHHKVIALTIGLLLSAFVPIGWANPINAAGIYYPNTGLIGVVILLILIVTLATKKIKLVLFCILTSAVTNFIATDNSNAISSTDVLTINTKTLSYSTRKDFSWRLDWQNKQLATLRANLKPCSDSGNIYLMPESSMGVIEPWSLTMWLNFSHNNLCQNDLLIANGESQLPDATLFNFDNQTLIIAKNGIVKKYSARASVPVMNPAKWHIFDKQPSGHLICYEMLMPWTNYLANRTQQNIFAQANFEWADANNHLPTIQQNVSRSWARLFGNNLFVAYNKRPL